MRTHSGGTELAPRYASDLSAPSFTFSSERIFTVLRGENSLSGERRDTFLCQTVKSTGVVSCSGAASVRSSLSVRQTELWIQDSQFLL